MAANDFQAMRLVVMAMLACTVAGQAQCDGDADAGAKARALQSWAIVHGARLDGVRLAAGGARNRSVVPVLSAAVERGDTLMRLPYNLSITA